MNSERAITDVAALLHAVKVYLIGRAVSGIMGLFERIAQADHAKHAAARHNDVALSVVGRTSVEDHCIIRFFGKASDYGAFFRMFRIAACGQARRPEPSACRIQCLPW